MFHYQGSRTDKHVREHEVYAIGYPGDFTSTQYGVSSRQQLENAKGMALVFATAGSYWNELAHHSRVLEQRFVATYSRASPLLRAVIISLVAFALLLLFLGVYKLTQRYVAPPKEPMFSSSGIAPPAFVHVPVSTPVAASATPKVAAPLVKARVKEKAAVDAAVKEEGDKKVQGVKKSERVRTLAETTGGPALVSLSIVPWGEVYLDGKLQGVSPPLLELQVVEGQHVMEIKNSTFPVFSQTIIAKPAGQIKIRHSFK
jgi:hypothetical protein